jgi:hypothetical protein
LSMEAEGADDGIRFGKQFELGVDLRSDKVALLVHWDPPTIADGNETELVIYGRVAPQQHIYSIRPQGEFGPEPTAVVIEGTLLEPVSEPMESEPIRLYDGAFDTPLWVHRDRFEIRRRYRLSGPIPPGEYRVYGTLQYQICSDRMCSLPLKTPFSTDITVFLAP